MVTGVTAGDGVDLSGLQATLVEARGLFVALIITAKCVCFERMNNDTEYTEMHI